MTSDILYSIIIPAWNEEDYLQATLDSIARAVTATSCPAEIIVVDNNSTDGTASIAKAAGAKVVFEPDNQISKARNAGAAAATGRYLIFVDADTEISDRLLEKAMSLLASDTCVGGGGLVTASTSASKGAQFGMDIWNWIAVRLRTAAGCFFFCRQDAFIAVGGFSERVYASEEVWLTRSLKKWAKQQNRLPDSTTKYTFEIIPNPLISTSLRKLEWYSKRDLFFKFFLVLVPFAVFSKRLCSFWYSKPGSNDAT